MNEANAYEIVAEILHPFDKKIDVNVGRTLSDRIAYALLKVYKEGQKGATNIKHCHNCGSMNLENNGSCRDC